MKKLPLVLLFLFLFVSPVQAQDRGWLFIPDLWLSTSIGTIPIIDNEYDMEAVGQGVGWLEQTAWIDDTWARIVLGSHSTGEFSSLDRLEVGSWIYVADYPHSTKVEGYRVERIIVTTPDDIRWLQPTENETLTLITCYGDLRLIVHAELAWSN